MKKTPIALISLAAALTLGATACGSGDDNADDADDTVTVSASDNGNQSDSNDDNDADDASSTSAVTAAKVDPADIEKAITAAEKEAGGTAYSIDLQDDGTTFEVETAKGDQSTEVTVGADGKATAGEQDTLDANEEKALKDAKVSLDEAIKTGLKDLDGTFDDAGLDDDSGEARWEVSTNNKNAEAQVAIDMSTGKVV